METLLRGFVGASALSRAPVSYRAISSRDAGRRLSRARATGAEEVEESKLVESQSNYGVVNVGLESARKKEKAEFVLFPISSVDGQSILLSLSPLPILALAALPGAEQITGLFSPIIELIRTWNLPEWLIHWGHPGNMAVVLFAMGGYGTYLGWQIRTSDDLDLKAKAKDLHPKLFAGLFFFFAAGAAGGVTSLLTQGKSIFESNHALTGLIGLALLAIQTTLSTQFEGKPELRSIHAYLGSSIMALFLVHAALGLQLGLSL